MIYNARHLLEKQSRHHPEYAGQLRQIRSYGPEISLAGAAIIALTGSGYCCALSGQKLLKLQKQRLLKMLDRGLEEKFRGGDAGTGARLTNGGPKAPFGGVAAQFGYYGSLAPEKLQNQRSSEPSPA